MLKLDNRGFAITGILYTLFVLFLMILLSVLAGLQTRRSLMEKSIMGIEDSFSVVIDDDDERFNEINEGYINYVNDNKRAPVDGKYVFEIVGDDLEGDVKKYTCYAYLKKGDPIVRKKIVYSPSNCNDYGYTFSFNPSDGGNVMTLVKVYGFGE